MRSHSFVIVKHLCYKRGRATNYERWAGWSGLGLYAEGWTEDQILENYPNLTKESLLAVFAYTRECMREEFLY